MGQTLTEIKNGTYTLIEEKDYTVSYNIVTLPNNYLGTLADGSAILTFVFTQVDNATLVLTTFAAPILVTPSNPVIGPSTTIIS